ncbi:MAG TPA: hypothetical protein VJU17_07605 [Gemmatimonadales bacterium]|nr:hypothetical protein [Gemmatimonadales bacterium]
MAFPRDEPALDLIKPLLRSELGGVDPMPNLAKAGVHPPDHVLRVVAKLAGNRIQADRLAAVKRLEAGRTVGLAEDPRPDAPASPDRPTSGRSALFPCARVQHRSQEAGPNRYAIEQVA